MTNLKQSFKAAQYHKRMTISLFFFFSLFLFLLTFVSQLIETQKFNLTFMLNKWEQLKHYLPTSNSHFHERLLFSNDLILKFYDNIRLILIISSFIVFFFLSLHATRSRKEEIYSLNYIGIKRRKILPRLLLELLFPVILSLPIIFCLLLVFHNQFVDKSIEVNQQVLRHYFGTEEVIQKKREESFIESSALTNQTSNSNEETTLIPYNKTSIFDINMVTNSSTHMIKNLIINFVLLYINMLIAYIVGFYSYTTLGFRRRRLIE